MRSRLLLVSQIKTECESQHISNGTEPFFKTQNDLRMTLQLWVARATRLAGVLAITGLLSSTPSATGAGFGLWGVGLKANSLGGAFRAVADDWSATYWNPAGLAYLPNSQLDFFTQVYSPRFELTPGVTLDGYGIGFRNGDKRFPIDKNYTYPGVSGFYRFPTIENFTAGVALYIPYALNTRWDLYTLPYSYKGDSTWQYPAIDFSSRAKVVTIHPAVAKEIIKDHLAAGVGVAISWGAFHYQRPFFYPAPLRDRPQEFFVVDNELGTSGWGLGGNLGFLLKANNNLQVGASVRSPMTLKLNGEFKQTYYFPFNIASQEKMPDSLKFFYQGEARFFSGTATGKMTLPWEAGAGMALLVGPVTLTADASFTRWANLWLLQFDLKGTGLLRQPLGQYIIPLQWQNTWRFSGGVQVAVSERLTLRSGYSFDRQSAVPDHTLTPLFPDMKNKHSLNTGAEVLFNHISLGYSFEWAFAKDRTITTLRDVDGDGQYDNVTGKYNTHSFTSYATARYHF